MKNLGCSDEDTKEKNRKGLVRLIQEQVKGALKGTKAAKMEYLETNGTYACLPSFGSS